MSNWENPQKKSDNSMDWALLFILICGIMTWVCYFMFIAGKG